MGISLLGTGEDFATLFTLTWHTESKKVSKSILIYPSVQHVRDDVCACAAARVRKPGLLLLLRIVEYELVYSKAW